MARQQLEINNNFSNFHNNINRSSKLPKSLTTTMPTFNGKLEKFELFEDLFQTILKIHNQLTEDDRINYFLSLMRGDALQTFRNINGPTQENLREILAVFRRKYVKHQSMWTPKHKFQKLVFDPANQKLVDFLDELRKLAKDAFGISAHALIEIMDPNKTLEPATAMINKFEPTFIFFENSRSSKTVIYCNPWSNISKSQLFMLHFPKNCKSQRFLGKNEITETMSERFPEF